jgi:hypothetical protein
MTATPAPRGNTEGVQGFTRGKTVTTRRLTRLTRE